jgi:hypothetical protein
VELGEDEVIAHGDMRTTAGILRPTQFIGQKVGWSGVGLYFRPVAPASVETTQSTEAGQYKCPSCGVFGEASDLANPEFHDADCAPQAPVQGSATALDFGAMVADAAGIPKDDEGPDWACPGCGNTDKNRFKTVQVCFDSPNGPAEYDLECEDCGGHEAQENPREALHMMADVVESQTKTITNLRSRLQSLMGVLEGARGALANVLVTFDMDDRPATRAEVASALAALESLTLTQPDGSKA